MDFFTTEITECTEGFWQLWGQASKSAQSSRRAQRLRFHLGFVLSRAEAEVPSGINQKSEKKTGCAKLEVSVIVLAMIKLEINKMSRTEKLQAMEALWIDLSEEESSVDSPSWHSDVLKETEQRVASGLESPVDWTQAKQELRKRFE